MTSDQPEVLGATPALRAAAAADALGDRVLVQWCADLLGGRAAYGDPSHPDPRWLAGRAVHDWGSPERLAGPTGYWAKVWAARTLLYVWDDLAAADLVTGCDDPAWRVREMCLKVAARWEIAPVADVAARAVSDEVPRVRVAALRVLAVAGEGEHQGAACGALGDEDPSVQRSADRTARALQRRLDRA